MRFLVTERITTNAPIADVGASMQANFQRIALSAKPVGAILRVTSIEATFGSQNRTDVTDITIKPAENGYLLVADVDYQTSAAFWFICILFLCLTGVFWVIPLIFYLVQKNTVKRAIEEGFRNVKNELSSSGRSVLPLPNASSHSAIADLEKLGSLLTQGLITQDEFNPQKQRLLDIPATNSVSASQPPPPIIETRSTGTSPPEIDIDEHETQAANAFAQAHDCVKNGQKEMAIDILKDIIKRFPNTKAAVQARKSLAPRNKA